MASGDQVRWPVLDSDADNLVQAYDEIFEQFEWFAKGAHLKEEEKVFTFVNRCLDTKGVAFFFS